MTYPLSIGYLLIIILHTALSASYAFGMLDGCGEDVLGSPYAFGRWCGDVRQRIGDTEFLVLEDAEGVVRQYIYPLDVAQRADERSELMQTVFVIGYTGNQHVAYPHGDTTLTQIASTVENVLIGVAREPSVLRITNVLDVEQHGIGYRHQLFKLAEERLVAPERLC